MTGRFPLSPESSGRLSFFKTVHPFVSKPIVMIFMDEHDALDSCGWSIILPSATCQVTLVLPVSQRLSYCLYPSLRKRYVGVGRDLDLTMP